MKSDDEVRMISAEVPILFSKACELFILDLTMRAWAHTADTNRRTLQRSDVADAIMEGEGMDFLVDIVPRDEAPDVAGQKKGDKAGDGEEKQAGRGGGGGAVGGTGGGERGEPGMTTETLAALAEQSDFPVRLSAMQGGHGDGAEGVKDEERKRAEDV